MGCKTPSHIHATSGCGVNAPAATNASLMHCKKFMPQVRAESHVKVRPAFC